MTKGKKSWKEITRHGYAMPPSLLKRETSFVSAYGTATFPNRGRLMDKVGIIFKNKIRS
jgi:hypothetical protein